jgi:hypothetical protein
VILHGKNWMNIQLDEKLDEENPTCAGLVHENNGFGSAKMRTVPWLLN